MTLGDRLRKSRETASKSLQEVADILGISKQTVHKYEQGLITNIPLDNIEKISLLYGVAPSYLMGWSATDIKKAENVVQSMSQRDSESARKMYQKILDAGVKPEDVDEVINFAILVAKKKTAE